MKNILDRAIIASGKREAEEEPRTWDERTSKSTTCSSKRPDA